MTPLALLRYDGRTDRSTNPLLSSSSLPPDRGSTFLFTKPRIIIITCIPGGGFLCTICRQTSTGAKGGGKRFAGHIWEAQQTAPAEKWCQTLVCAAPLATSRAALLFQALEMGLGGNRTTITTRFCLVPLLLTESPQLLISIDTPHSRVTAPDLRMAPSIIVNPCPKHAGTVVVLQNLGSRL